MFGKLVKIAIWVFSETNWGKVIFDEELRISSFSYFKRKRFGPLAKKNRKRCGNWILRVQRNFWWFFLEQLHFFLSLSEYEWRTVNFWQKNFSGIVKNDIWVYIGSFWEGTTFFEKHICSFWSIWDFEPYFVLWREYFITVVQNAFHVSIGRVWAKIFFLEKVYFDSFS